MDHDNNHNDESNPRSILGIVYIMLGAFSFSVMFLLVKLMKDTNPFTLVFYRSLVQILLSIVSLFWSWRNKQHQQHEQEQHEHEQRNTTTTTSTTTTSTSTTTNNNDNDPSSSSSSVTFVEWFLGSSQGDVRLFLILRGSLGAMAVCAFFFWY